MAEQRLQSRLKAALARFRQLYGAGEVAALRAPARINILGEHVDYVSYLPTASLAFGSREHEMLMLFRAAGDGQVHGASMNEAFPPFSFALSEEPVPDSHERSWETYVFDRPAPVPHWSNYVRGAVFFARWKYGADLSRGFSFLVDSAIPPNSGASSSSALVVLAGAAVRGVNQVSYALGKLARDSSQAEWYLGTRGGALDHTAICLAREGHAVHISHATQRAEIVPLPCKGYCWIACFSHEAAKGREVMLEYNERAAVSRLLIPAMLHGGAIDRLPAAITLGELAQMQPQTYAECERVFPALVRERRDRPLKLRDRARHHLSEIARVNTAMALLSGTSLQQREAMLELGKLINASHESLRDLYEVSTSEVEYLVEIIRRDPQVYGARLMGGGFGGSVLALTTAENARGLIARVESEFYLPRGRNGECEGSVMVSTPGAGLSSVES